MGVICRLLAFVILISMLPSVLANGGYVESNLVLYSTTTYPYPVEVGDEGVAMRVIFQRSEGAAWNNVRIRANFPFPFTATKSDTLISRAPAPSSTPASLNALFTFDVSEEAEPGTYKVPISVTYTDEVTGAANTINRNAYIEVSSEARLEVRDVHFEPSSLAVGGDFKMTVSVENTGSLPASNVQAYLDFTGTSQPVLEFSPNLPLTVNIMPAKATTQLTFTGKVTPYSATGGFPTTLTLTYGEDELTHDFRFIIAEGSELDFTPVDMTVEPGKRQAMSFELRNRGSVSYSNVRLNMSSIQNLAFLDNSIYVGDIGPNEDKTVEVELTSSRNLVDGIYPLSITISSAQSTETERTSLIVQGIPIIKLAGVASDIERPHAGQPISFSVQLENVGTGDARSVKATMACDSITGTPESYVGTVEVDDTGTAIFDISFQKPGEQSICADLAFTDNAGNSYGEKVNFSFFVYDAPTDYTVLYLMIFAAAVYLFYKRRTKIKAQLSKVI